MVYYSTYLIAELGLGLVVISTTPSFGILNDSTRLLKKLRLIKLDIKKTMDSKEDTTEPSGTFLF
jgi:hypothetical protein